MKGQCHVMRSAHMTPELTTYLKLKAFWFECFKNVGTIVYRSEQSHEIFNITIIAFKINSPALQALGNQLDCVAFNMGSPDSQVLATPGSQFNFKNQLLKIEII